MRSEQVIVNFGNGYMNEKENVQMNAEDLLGKKKIDWLKIILSDLFILP